MYIKKYWGNFIGGSDDSLNLVAFLEDQKKEEIPLSEIFTKIGLDKQNWGDFCQDWAGQAELGLPPDRGVFGVYTLRWCGDGLPLRH